ncbi:MAG: EamA family transporter [Nocardiopsaceae bacterium]|nr:EamA family transporter [Nocardiopsaceae bacterium]
MGLIRPAGLIRQAPDRGGPPRRPAWQPARRPGQVAARIPASALVLTGVISLQLGAGFAATLFAQVPATAVTALRLWTAGLFLAIASARGLRAAVAGLAARGGRRDRWRDAAVVVAFGLVLGVMNFAIYQSFARIPLGIAVTVEFLGPLALAVASSRRLLDLLWVALAGAGVALLAPGGGGLDWHARSLAGLGFGLAAAASWAAYILLSRATGRRFAGTSGLALAMLVAAVAITPAGVIAGGRALLRPGVIAVGAAIGLLSSTIPYSLELETLRRIPARVFGIWMSLEPAVAALVGLVLLGQALTIREWAAIGCVMAACAGAARGGEAQQPQA